ncbi:hypothetical protein [Mesorhizobium sp. WSM2239]|uniref:Mandelate racemase/muconate lactonizing enzyme N-terminal domain-containing protein n=2 Tax=unclassified Mesorhizobium TaxID=325217 RepID=A0AAU8D1M7_9HYPH
MIDDVLAEILGDADAFHIPQIWAEMVGAVRNIGWRGVCASAMSAVDVALWDVKANLLDLSFVGLLGSMREAVPIYGSGGFISYRDGRPVDQLLGWVERDGCRAVKIKVGRPSDSHMQRVRTARSALAPGIVRGRGRACRGKCKKVAFPGPPRSEEREF